MVDFIFPNLHLSDATPFLEMSLGLNLALYTYVIRWLDTKRDDLYRAVEVSTEPSALAELMHTTPGEGHLDEDRALQLSTAIALIRSQTRQESRQRFNRVRKIVQRLRSFSPYSLTVGVAGLVTHAYTGDVLLPAWAALRGSRFAS